MMTSKPRIFGAVPTTQVNPDGHLVRLESRDARGRETMIWVKPARALQIAENLNKAVRAVILNQAREPGQ